MTALRRNPLTLATILVGLSASAVLSAPLFRLTVSPLNAIAPAGVHLEVVVPRDPTNRLITLVIDGPLSRLSEQAMEGDAAPVIYTLDVPELPAGEYEASVIITKGDGSTHRERRVFARQGASP